MTYLLVQHLWLLSPLRSGSVLRAPLRAIRVREGLSIELSVPSANLSSILYVLMCLQMILQAIWNARKARNSHCQKPGVCRCYRQYLRNSEVFHNLWIKRDRHKLARKKPL